MTAAVAFGHLPWPTLLSSFAAIGLSGMLRGFTGFGFGLAATPLLSLFLPPSLVVPLVLLLQVGSSFIGFPSAVAHCDRTSAGVMSLAALITTPLGIWLLCVVSVAHARLCIAVAAIAAVIVLASGFRYDRPHGRGFILPFGLGAGLLAGLCAMPGPPVLAYYLGTGVKPAVARASMILIFLATGVLALVTGAVSGLVHGDTLLAAAVGAPAMIVGTILGSALFDHAPEGYYRSIGIGSLAVIAVISFARAML